MRKRIDCHVHLMPARPLPWTDPLNGNVIYPYGKIRRGNGNVGQRMPAYFADSAFPVDRLLASMDENGIEKAVVMAHLESEVGETACHAVETAPDRLVGAVSVVPEPESVEKLRYWVEKGLRILKFEMRSMNERYPGLTLTDPGVLPILAEAERLGMLLVVDPGPVSFPCYRPDCLREALERHPGLKAVVCHIGLPCPGLREKPELYKKWRAMIELGQDHEVYYDLAAIPDLFQEENFPYPSAMELLKEIYDLYGADRLLWGTDVPGTFRNATYQQMIEMFERQPFFTEEDKDKLFYRNAEALFFASAKNL